MFNEPDVQGWNSPEMWLAWVKATGRRFKRESLTTRSVVAELVWVPGGHPGILARPLDGVAVGLGHRAHQFALLGLASTTAQPHHLAHSAAARQGDEEGEGE